MEIASQLRARVLREVAHNMEHQGDDLYAFCDLVERLDICLKEMDEEEQQQRKQRLLHKATGEHLPRTPEEWHELRKVDADNCA